MNIYANTPPEVKSITSSPVDCKISTLAMNGTASIEIVDALGFGVTFVFNDVGKNKVIDLANAMLVIINKAKEE